MNARGIELTVPGTVLGALAGVFAGILGLVAGEPPAWALITAVTLSLPLAGLGAGYGLLLGRGVLRPGRFAPSALYWIIGFPLARLVHESAQRLVFAGRIVLPGGLAGFLLFQCLVSVGFAIGFVWAHERFMPHWLLRVRAHNAVAQRLLAEYLVLADPHGNRHNHR